MWVFLFALVAYGATTGGSMATDVMSYEVTKGIVEQGTVGMSRDVFHMEAHRGVDGRYYAPYGIGHAVYSVPFYVAARAAERWTGLSAGREESVRKAGFVAGSAVAGALTVWVVFLFAWRLSSSARAASMTALAVGFGTFLWPYAKFGFSAPLAALCVAAGTYGVWTGVRLDRPAMLALGGSGFGGALLVKHELALLCLPVGLWIIVESRRQGSRNVDWRLVGRRAVYSGAPVLAAMLITLYYNHVRFGNPLDTGYLRDDTVASGSFWVGLTGLLFSPGRSLFLYSPIAAVGLAALIGFARRDRSTALLLAGEFLIALCFYASLAHWDAERSYGPRYLLPVVPLIVLPLAPWLAESGSGLRRRVLSVLFIVSVLVQLPGVFVDFSKAGFSAQVGHRSWEERRWMWTASGLRLNSVAALDAIPENLRYLTGAAEPPRITPARAGAEDFSQQFDFSLDFWWVYLFYMGAISAPTALAIGVACLATIVLLAWKLRRELRRV